MGTKLMEKQAWERYNRGERGLDVIRGFMPKTTCGERLGSFHESNNDLLNVDLRVKLGSSREERSESMQVELIGEDLNIASIERPVRAQNQSSSRTWITTSMRYS